MCEACPYGSLVPAAITLWGGMLCVKLVPIGRWCLIQMCPSGSMSWPFSGDILSSNDLQYLFWYGSTMAVVTVYGVHACSQCDLPTLHFTMYTL